MFGTCLRGRHCPSSRSVSQSNGRLKEDLQYLQSLSPSLYDTDLAGTDDVAGPSGSTGPSSYIYPHRHEIKWANAKLPPLQTAGQAPPPGGERVTKHVFNYKDNRWTSHQIRVQIEEKPFAEGFERACWRVKDLSQPAGHADARVHVAKLMMKTERCSNYFLECALHVMAGALAKQFTALKVSKWAVDFIDHFVFEFTDRAYLNHAGPVLMSVEPYMETELLHLSLAEGNCPSCNTHKDDSGLYSIGQTFSHFTEYVSGGSLAVLDLQAFRRRNPRTGADELVMTDPRIGTSKFDLYGPKFMHMLGAFSKNHKCNRFCQQLMLPGLHELGRVRKDPLPTPDQQILDRLVHSTANTLRDITKLAAARKAVAGLPTVSRTPVVPGTAHSAEALVKARGQT